MSCILAALSAQMSEISAVGAAKVAKPPVKHVAAQRKREVTSGESFGGHAAFFNSISLWWRFPFEKEEKAKVHTVENKSVRCHSPHLSSPTFWQLQPSNPRHNVKRRPAHAWKDPESSLCATQASPRSPGGAAGRINWRQAPERFLAAAWSTWSTWDA